VYETWTHLEHRMPHMSDPQRKRTIAEWVVKTKKQVVKLYAVVRWSRDAGVVQKAMVSSNDIMSALIAERYVEYHSFPNGPESPI
jgi:hypothetical protein